MTDASLPVHATAGYQLHSVSTSPNPPVSEQHAVQPLREVDAEEDDGEIDCICAYSDDDGNTIQCDACNRWQHIICYYPVTSEVPGDNDKHYCVRCQPRTIDARKATERQRRALEQRAAIQNYRRNASKSHKKKVKESPQLNGLSGDRHSHLHSRDRKSASPRDQPPPAKKPKISHRASGSVNPHRKRNGTTQRSPSRSPDPSAPPAAPIPYYSEEFLRLHHPGATYNETDCNLLNSIAVTNSLSTWLKDSEALEQATGLPKENIFKRWVGHIEDIPGRPEPYLEYRWDDRLSFNGRHPQWPCLLADTTIPEGGLIGELKGHVGHKEEYMDDPENRWATLRHPEPFVFFHPQLPIYIDARQEGSYFRHVRRSCQPNADLQVMITGGTEYHFCFIALKEITPGEEITVAWHIDQSIRDKMSVHGPANGANFHMNPETRSWMSNWISTILANCGPCACRKEGCLMARFDRRGQPPAPEAIPSSIKAPKMRKKKSIAPIETSHLSNSRSGSEVRKAEHDEDMTDSRSVSESYHGGSASRDITPSTHYSAAASVPEMSERERKKLMREEEMFRRQEQEHGRRGKKRHSGGSNLNTPSATSSVSSRRAGDRKDSKADENVKKQLGLSSDKHSKFADAGTHTRSNPSSARSSRRGTKVGQAPSRSLFKSSSSSSRSVKPVYTDSGIQCDMDADELAAKTPPPPRPQRRYISVTQRLLQRCASNNVNRKASTQEEEKPVVEKDNTAMDVDEQLDHTPEIVVKPDPPSPVEQASIPAPDVEMAGEEDPPKPSPVPEVADAIMKDAEPEPSVAATTPPISPKSPSSHRAGSPTNPEPPRTHSHPPMDPPSPPWTKEPTPPPSSAGPPPPTSFNRPEMHVVMPPPPANLLDNAATNGAPQTAGISLPTSSLAQSPLALTPGLQGHLFSPSVQAAVAPSPARKKMSLSDYTKRSKARETEPGAEHVSPATSAAVPASVSTAAAEQVLQGSAVTDSPKAVEEAEKAADPVTKSEQHVVS
ncbi:SET domain-containing protein 3 [Zalaria obscura]|uniref:SET domain-containing protein 3 n=1 Tax=Zalaria obscura TaxID=2024903 RepID=A0ACC3SIA5_9PEZI